MLKKQQRIHISSNEYSTDTPTAAADATALDAAPAPAPAAAHDVTAAAPDVARVADHAAVVHATGDRENKTKTNNTCNGTARWSNVGLTLWSNVA